MPCISVIVPVYKVEHWLPACVDSLLAQTFTDFELILVDDGSPDRCPDLCDRYAETDTRIRVIHQKNGGLSAARNSGIECAQGEYLCFVDSDDVVSPDYLKKLYTAAVSTQADLAVCAIQDLSEDGKLLEHTLLPNAEGVFSGKELMDHFFGINSVYYTVAWNKLYRTGIWRELRYPEGLIHEDDAVAHLLYSRCQKVACIADLLYFYRQRKGSIMNQTVSPGAFDGVTAHALWCRYFAETPEDKPLLDQALKCTFMLFLSLTAQCRTAPASWPLYARWHSCQSELKALLPLLKDCSTLTILQKFSCYKWVNKALPLPQKGEKKRLALLLPPGLPVPAVQGGAVETLAQHLLEQNEQQKQLELVIVCQYDAAAATLAARYKQTLFRFQSQPGPSILHSIKYRLAALAARPIHWNRWYSLPLNFLKHLSADAFFAEGGDLTGWKQASRVLGREKFYAHLHGELLGAPKFDRIYSRAIAISSYIGKLWSNGCKSPALLLPNCVNLDRFNPGSDSDRVRCNSLRKELGFVPEDFVVIFCGRTCPEKGIHKLVEAISLLPDEHIKLLVIGSPFFAAESHSSYFDKLQADAAALGNRVVFTGYVHNSRLPDYYRLANAACFPALWEEPAGITAIEAMACGCPIIATRSGGMPEYLQGSNAILLDRSEIWDGDKLVEVPGKPPLSKALALVIELLKSQPDTCHSMSQAGAKAALRFSAGEYYRRTVHILESEEIK